MNGGDGRLPVGVDSAVLGRFDAGAPCFDGEGAWGGPLCLSSNIIGGFGLVNGAVAQHGEQHVA
ncbi:hypothetical protein ACGY1D_06665, partial [Burkholderia pseudomallei]